MSEIKHSMLTCLHTISHGRQSNEKGKEYTRKTREIQAIEEENTMERNVFSDGSGMLLCPES